MTKDSLFKVMRIGGLFFVFLIFGFGIHQTVFAAACGFGWQNSDCTITISYEDPNLGDNSGLAICEYQLALQFEEIGGQSIPSADGWKPAEDADPSESCSGDSASFIVLIKDEVSMSGIYDVWWRAEDQAGNKGGPAFNISVRVDTDAPSKVSNLSSSSPTSQWSNDKTVDVSWTSATDVGSGLDGYSIVWDTNAATIPNKTINIQENVTSRTGTLSNGDSHYFHISPVDNVGNWGEAAHIGPFRIDTIAPTIDTFTINGKSFLDGVSANSEVSIAWAATDTGGSGIQKREVWCSPNCGGSLDTWTRIENNAISPFLYNPGDGIWWFGIHVLDNARTLDNVYNCITESTDGLDKGHCGGVSSDILDTRTDRGPIRVIFDATLPTIPSLDLDAGSDSGIFNDDNITKLTSLTFTTTGDSGSIITLYRDGIDQGIFSEGSPRSISVDNQGLGSNISYRARAQDALGNLSNYSEVLSVAIDIEDPLISGGCNFPCSGETNDRSPILSWNPVSDPSLPVHHRLQISTNSGFSNPGLLLDQSYIQQGSISSIFKLGDAENILANEDSAISNLFLQYGSTYYWRVQTEDGAGNISGEDTSTSNDDWSYTWSFKVVRPVELPIVLTVSTTVASSIGETSVVLNGYLDSDGGEASDVRFNWGTTTAYGNDTGWLNNKSSGTSISKVISDLQDDTLYHYRAEATNSMGTSFGSDVTFTTLASNRSPSISQVNNSPDPIAANANLTFDVFWSDPDGDSIKLFVCKSADGVTGGTCSGDTWCKDTSPTSFSPATCIYRTDAADSGINNYYAYVCDGDNECSSSFLGTFQVDATSPDISSFSVTPEVPAWVNNANPDVTVSWTVTEESGGSFLREVQVWRSGNGGGNWDLVSTVSAPSSSTSWTSSTTDAPSSGVYLYGLHAVDNVGNEITESETGFALVSVQADTRDPTPAVTNPGDGAWFNDDFIATFDDSDLGGSGLVNTCDYRFIGLNPEEGGSDLTSGDLTRQCDLDTKTISVGAGKVCQFEGENRCKVQTRASDNAGNSSGWQSRSFGVDFTDPVITNIQPSLVQVGVVTTLTADLTDPIGHITGCSLFTAPVGSIEWTTDPTVIDPIPCENGDACTVSGDHIFPSTGEYQVTFGCTDSAGNTGWGASTAQAETLSVVAQAIPSSGTQQIQFDLKATVSGTMVGTINYKFDCTSDGIWELEVDGESSTVYTAEDVCSYPSSDTYNAKVFVERGVGTAEDTVEIIISSNASPSAVNLQDNNDTAVYCFAGAPPIILSWDFDDPNLPGDSQIAYQVQVDINAGFSTPEIDSGKVTSSSASYVPVGLLYDETYWWRVMVWDKADDSSAWATGTSFTTPVHVYPTTDFSWSPTFPTAEEEIQFTDETIFAAGSSNQSWAWDFRDTSSSTEQNPTHAYAEMISHTVQLTVSDDAGSCASSQIVRVSVPLPEWLEISPF